MPARDADPPVLALTDVAVAYPGAARPAPEGATLHVRPGEVVLLMGPSGCGKSTLSLTVDGLVPRSAPARVAGSLLVRGVPVAERTVAELSRDVGMVFQDVDAQIVMGTVLDEVAFGVENLRMPVPEVLAHSEAALRRMGLWDRRDDDPATLSGGQKQRLAIACALAMGVGLLVLDEPTANLDPAGAEVVYEALAEVVADGEHAVLLIEHDVDAALPVVDRVVVLDRAGRTRLDGPPRLIIGGHGEELDALGLRLPAAARLGLALRRAGVDVPVLPLAVDELARLAPPAPVVVGDAERRDAPGPAVGPAAVELTGVTITRGRRTVLEDVDLTVPEGGLVGIVGVNGSGKTSLLQTMAGLIRPARGEVQVLGAPLPRRRAARVGYVFQNPEHQFVTDTVRDELALSLDAAGVPPAGRARRIEETLGRFGLREAADRHPFLLSGGQKRRLSVATALVDGSRILLLDEPTFGQDQAYADALMDLLTELNEEGATVVLVSHDLDLVAERTHSTVLVADGRVSGVRPTAEVFADTELLERAGLRRPAMAAARAACQMPGGTR